MILNDCYTKDPTIEGTFCVFQFFIKCETSEFCGSQCLTVSAELEMEEICL